MIKLEAVTKNLKGKLVLEEISLSFEKGKLYLLRGDNGSGKTMLLRLLCDLIKPTSGHIQKPDYTYGVIIENPSFVEHETAFQNLKFLASIQKKINSKDIEVSLEKFNLLSNRDIKVKKYSLGMKQRLALCQATMENPDVLLLDEPFNALDDQHFDLVTNMIQEIKEDKIVVIAAHGFDIQKYPIFDEVILLKEGKVANVEVNV